MVKELQQTRRAQTGMLKQTGSPLCRVPCLWADDKGAKGRRQILQRKGLGVTFADYPPAWQTVKSLWAEQAVVNTWRRCLRICHPIFFASCPAWKRSFAVSKPNADDKEALHWFFVWCPVCRLEMDGKGLCRPGCPPLSFSMADGKVPDPCSGTYWRACEWKPCLAALFMEGL